MTKYLLFFTVLISQSALAERGAMSGIVDHRIKVIPYIKGEVYRLNVHYNYSTIVTLAPYEKIIYGSIKPGIDNVFYIETDSKNKLAIKPKVEGIPDTNLTLSTNLRDYYFFIPKVHYSKSPKSKKMTFGLEFSYLQDELEAAKRKEALEQLAMQEKKEKRNKKNSNLCENSHPYVKNNKYLLEGSMPLRPEFVFDDGKFTYMRISGAHGAISYFDADGIQTIANTSQDNCGYLVVHGVYRKIVITSGDKATCITNMAFKENDNFQNENFKVTGNF